MSSLAPAHASILRVAFYVRVSTDEQVERATSRNQSEFLDRKFAVNFEADSLEPMRFVGKFVDEGSSGAVPFAERPAGARLLALVEAGEVDLVIVYRLDRLGRTIRVLLDAHDFLEKHKVALMSATEPFDTRTSIGKFVFQLLGSIAELERAMIKDRTMGGRDRVARDGKHMTGPVPLGYDVDKDGYMIESTRVVPELGMTEADLVRHIFGRLAEGESARQIALSLDTLGVKSTKRYVNRHGIMTEKVSLHWSEARIYPMIQASTYIGQRELNYTTGKIVQQVPPLIDAATLDAARAKLDRNSAWRRRTTGADGVRQSVYTYLLGGRIVCNACDKVMSGNYKKARPEARAKFVYGCTQAPGRSGTFLQARQVCAGTPYINGWKVETAVLAKIDEFVAQPEQFIRLLEEQAQERRAEGPSYEAQERALRDELIMAEEGRQEINVQMAKGRLKGKDLDDALDASAAQVAKIHHAMAQLDNRRLVATRISEQLSEAHQVLQDFGPLWTAARQANERAVLFPLVQRFVREVRVLAKDRVVVTLMTGADETAVRTDRVDQRLGYAERSDLSSLCVPLALMPPRLPLTA